MSDEMKTIKKSYFDMLQRNNQILQALFECGVDNWERYNEAMKLLGEDEEDE